MGGIDIRIMSRLTLLVAIALAFMACQAMAQSSSAYSSGSAAASAAASTAASSYASSAGAGTSRRRRTITVSGTIKQTVTMSGTKAGYTGKLKEVCDLAYGITMGTVNSTKLSTCSGVSCYYPGITQTSTAARRDVKVSFTTKIYSTSTLKCSNSLSSPSGCVYNAAITLKANPSSLTAAMTTVKTSKGAAYAGVTTPTVKSISTPTQTGLTAAELAKALAGWIIGMIIACVIIFCICPILVCCLCFGGAAMCCGAAAASNQQGNV